MRILAIVVALFVASVASTYAPQVRAQSAMLVPADVDRNIRAAVKAWTRGRYQVAEVRATPMPNLYEFRIGKDLFYIDGDAKFALVEGELVELATNVNLTRARMAEVMAIDFSTLPLDQAIKQTNGKGGRVVALFEDPNCGYCRRLRADLMRIDDITIYTFPYPILAADSDSKSRKAMCASDRSKAWIDLMLSGREPDNDGSCETPIAAFKKLGESHGISATPTMFFPSGFRLEGYAPPTRFVDLLNKHQKKSPKS